MDREKNAYQKAVEFIDHIPQFGHGNGVIRSRYALQAMNNPERKMKIIHVAGTNGKGSVCCYLSNMLQANGYSVGLFTSPHLVKVNERIRINGEVVSDRDFEEAFAYVHGLDEKIPDDIGFHLAYFDYMFAIAMHIFERKNVDFVILETGLGGKLDATNAVENPLLTILTSISFDHCALLGNTITEIAGEKAGIIKPHIPVVYIRNNPESAAVIEERARQCEADAIQVENCQWKILKNSGKRIDFLVHNRYYKSNVFSVSTSAVYQVMNSLTALTALKVLETRGMISQDEKKTAQAVTDTRWEGRMEEVEPDIYVDGAHNPDGIQAFLASVPAVKADRKCHLLFSVVKDKNYDQMIAQLCEKNLFDSYIITQIEGARKLDDQEISSHFRKYTDKPVVAFDNVKEAFSYATAVRDDGVLMCAGSLYLVGLIKEFVQDLQKEDNAKDVLAADREE